MNIYSLPSEIIFYIFSLLNLYDRSICCQVCKLWNNIGNSLQLQLSIYIYSPTPPLILRKNMNIPSNGLWWTPKFLACNKNLLKDIEILHIGRNNYTKYYSHSLSSSQYISPLLLEQLLSYLESIKQITIYGSFWFTKSCLYQLYNKHSLKYLSFKEISKTSFIPEFINFIPFNLYSIEFENYLMHLGSLLGFLFGNEISSINNSRNFNFIQSFDYQTSQLSNIQSLSYLKRIVLRKCNIHCYFRWPEFKLNEFIIENSIIFGQPISMLPLFKSSSNILTHVSFYNTLFLHQTGSSFILIEQLKELISVISHTITHLGLSSEVLFEDIFSILKNSKQLESLKLKTNINSMIEAIGIFSILSYPLLTSFHLTCSIINKLGYNISQLENDSNKLLSYIPIIGPNINHFTFKSDKKSNHYKMTLNDSLLKSLSILNLKSFEINSTENISIQVLKEFLHDLPLLKSIILGNSIQLSYSLSDIKSLQSLYPCIKHNIISNIPEIEKQYNYNHNPDSKCTICDYNICKYGCNLQIPKCIEYDHSIICREAKHYCSAGCGMLIKSYEFAKHYETCINNTIVCFECQIEFSKQDYHSHIEYFSNNYSDPESTCILRNYPYQCLNNCKSLTECSKYEVCCPSCRLIKSNNIFPQHQINCKSQQYKEIYPKEFTEANENLIINLKKNEFWR